MGVGELSVNVYGQSVGEPIEDASVSILDSETKNPIENFLTSSSGKTDYLEIDTPPKEYSMEPDAPKPYSTCDVVVKKENSETVSINGVQIFADSLSIQNVYLKSQYDSSRVFYIPGHSLYENFPPKIAEDPIKPNPNASGLAVLSRPVIPEYIVVHDGIPSDSSASRWASCM